MHTFHSSYRCNDRGVPQRARRGFSFVELMFAIVILGIGFIMLAAMLPVAALQTKATMEETAAITVASNGVNMIGGAMRADDPNLRTSSFRAMDSASSMLVFEAVRGDMISRADPRYAFVPLVYRFPTDASHAEVIVAGVAVRTKSAYTAMDATAGIDLLRNTLEPKPVSFVLHDGATSGVEDWITFTDGDAAVALGTFIVVAGDPTANGGAIYQISESKDKEAGTWTLSPQYDVTPAIDGSSFDGVVVGRSLATDGVTYEGESQDVRIVRANVGVN